MSRTYYINDRTRTSRSERQRATGAYLDYLTQQGYREVDRATWIAFRQEHAQPGAWVVWLPGAERRAVELWARERGARPQELCAQIITQFLRERGQL